jgi:hypothetical protein
MIARHYHDGLVGERGLLLASDTRDLNRQRFQAAQAASRLGKLLLARACRRHRWGVERANRVDGGGYIRAESLSHVLQPFMYSQMSYVADRGQRDRCLNPAAW